MGPQRLPGSAVTPSLFPMIGARPALGRFFRPDEAAKGNDAVMVLSDRAWREFFSADPSIVGRGVVMDDRPYTIVGVAQPDFFFPDRRTRLWVPYTSCALPPTPWPVNAAR